MQKIQLFLEQFSKCNKEGFVKRGEFLKFKNHPELFPDTSYQKLEEILKDNPDEGIQIIECGRFGGRCHAHNLGCCKLRGYILIDQ